MDGQLQDDGHRWMTPLFGGVGPVCHTVTWSASVDGAAAAVLTPQIRTRELAYATDGIAAQLDGLQFTLGEGPCLDAYLSHTPQLCPHLDAPAALTRWPGFASEASELGVQAVYSFPVPGHRRPLGVLELYRHTAGGLGTGEYDAALACARMIGRTWQSNWYARLAHAGGDVALAVEAATISSVQLDPSAAPVSYATVYLATGMLAVQLATSADEALDRMRAHAYAHHQPIATVAADIVSHRLSLRDHRDH